MKRYIYTLLVLGLLCSCFSMLPVVRTQATNGNVTLQLDVTKDLAIYSRVGRNNESFRFEWLGNKLDLELFFNATYKNNTKLFSLRDFEDDFNVTVNYVVNKTDNVHFGWVIDNVENVSDYVHNAWFKIEDTQPFDYDDIELERLEVSEEPYNITLYLLPNNLVLSFEDLEHKGFTVGHQNKTSTSIKGFKNKTSWDLDPVVYSPPNVQVTGGASGSELDMEDVYNADKLGELELLANTTAGNHTLTTQVQPADNKSIPLQINASMVTVNGWCNITGTEKDDSVQTENITITANQTYTTSEYWKTVTYINCSGTWGIAVNQSQWGVIWRTTPILAGAEEQYYVDNVTLVLGDDSTPTYFKLTDVQVYFYTSLRRWNAHIRVEKNVWFQLGDVADSNAKTGKDGCHLYFDSPNDGLIYGIVHSGNTKTAYRFYATTFHGRNTDLGGGNPNATIYDCTFLGVYGRLTDSKGGDYNRLTFSRGFLSNSYGTMNDIYVIGPSSLLYSYHMRGGVTSELVGFKTRNNTYIAYFERMDVAFNITDADTDTWLIKWRVGPVYDSEGEVYRKYSFDLRVLHDGNQTAINNVNATLTDINNSTVFSFLTDANGQISTEKVIYAFYNQTMSNDTLTSTFLQGPHTLTLTKSGLQTSTTVFNITAPTDWIKTMQSESAEGFDSTFYLLGIVTFIPALFIIGVWRKKKKNAS